jgi:hypothetical protein
MSATIDPGPELELIDREADVILLSREAIAQGLDERLSRPERIRRWSYEFDPSGLELLRRAIDRVQHAREAATPEPVAAG